MKLAITGKGGVGKTTLSSLLARLYATEGRNVTAIEANLDQNLAMALGFTPDEAQSIKPIAELADLIEERTGAKPGTHAPFYKLNPKVDDIPERFSMIKNGVRLLLLGAVKSGGSGCFCPESALLRTLMTHLLLSKTDVLIMDMDAGVEHISRGTTESVDAFIIVVEPGKRSIQTAETIRKLALDLGINKSYIVGNKITSRQDKQFIIDNTKDFEVLGFLKIDPDVREADLKGMSAFDNAPQVLDEVKAIKNRLEEINTENI
ncbi:AAA family ATPase [Chloroflexota bacterium]